MKKYTIEGLDCANCAEKMEKAISSIQGVDFVQINFLKQELQIDVSQDNTMEKVFTCIKSIEPDVKLYELSDEEMLTFYLEGLDCANCAQKIESYIKQMKHVKDASLQFSSGTLHVKCEKKNKQAIITQILEIVPTLEEGVQIHCEKQQKSLSKYEIFYFRKQWKLYIGCILFIIGCITHHKYLFCLAYILSGYQVLFSAFRNICRKEVFDENFLMSVATLGAFYLGEYQEAVAVMLFYEIGELFQSYAVQRSRTSISSLMDLRSDIVHVVDGNQIVDYRPEEVEKDMDIIVKPGERIPLDGYILDGVSNIDTAALTGESLPLDVKEGDHVLAGCINLQGILKLKVERVYAQSEVARILELVEQASSKKAPLEKFISRFARVYTPVVVICAVLLSVVPALIFENVSFRMMLESALTFLVVSCPCALVVSIPLGLFAGIGSASKKGILIKGGSYLEALKNIETVVFDKTGTLTKGVFEVSDIKVYQSSKEEILRYAAYAEVHSSHPIALSIQKAYSKVIDTTKIQSYQEQSGFGIQACIDDKQILVGNAKLMKEHQIECMEVYDIGTIVHVACEQQYLGYICLKDELKQSSEYTVNTLRFYGVKQIVMLTGDRKEVGEDVANRLKLDAVYTQLLPKDKLNHVEKLLKSKDNHKKLMYVGDGMNDAPVLARADIGVAMGGIGSDAAVEAADIVFMNDDPSALIDAIKISRNTMRILKQNIIFSLAIKVFVMIFAVLGIANMWMGVFADVGVTILAVLNAMRLLRQ